MKIIASSDLGGLGAREGVPVTYEWTLPNLMPLAVPWVVVLALLALKANRHAQAWWILAPLVLATGVGTFLQQLDFFPSGAGDFFGESFHALLFGVAAVWLLAGHLGQQRGFARFLAILATLAGTAGLTLVAGQQWDDLWWLPVLIASAFCAGALALALSLAGVTCRRRYSPAGFLGWLVVWLAAGLIVLTLPFFFFAMMTTQAGWAMLIPYGGGILMFAGLSFAAVLPFLLLSFATAFYRERLRSLLLLPEVASSPPSEPLVPTVS